MTPQQLVQAAADPATETLHRPVRVCVATLNFHPVYAGPAIRFARYLPLFTARGVLVRVFTGTPDVATAAASDLELNWNEWGIGRKLPPIELAGRPIDRVRLPDRGPKRRAFLFGQALAREFGRKQEKPDILQLLSCNVPMVPALLQLRRLRIPMVFTATMLPDPRRRDPLKRELLRRYVAGPMNLVQTVVVSSAVMRDRLRELGVVTTIRVIPNGVDTERFRPAETAEERERVRGTLGIGNDDLMALFVGPISRRKGVDLLLGAFKRLALRLPNLHLVVAGPLLDKAGAEPAEFEREIQRLVRDTGAEHRVHLTGKVVDPEAYMRAADLFVFPSRREGMPNVVPEAMASGLATVMTPFVGLPPEFGDDGRQHLIAAFDEGALAERIEQLATRPELRMRMGLAAREWAHDKLRMEPSVDRYAELYRDLSDERDLR